MTVRPTRSMSVILILVMVVAQFAAFEPMRPAYAEDPTIPADSAWFSNQDKTIATTGSGTSTLGFSYHVSVDAEYAESIRSLNIYFQNDADNTWFYYKDGQFHSDDQEYPFDSWDPGDGSNPQYFGHSNIGRIMPAGEYTAYIKIIDTSDQVITASGTLDFTYVHEGEIVAPTATFTSPDENSTTTAPAISFVANYDGDLASATIQIELVTNDDGSITGGLAGNSTTGYSYITNDDGEPYDMAIDTDNTSLSYTIKSASASGGDFEYGDYIAYLNLTDTQGMSYSQQDTIYFTAEYASPSGLVTSPANGSILQKSDYEGIASSLQISGTYEGTCVNDNKIELYLTRAEGETVYYLTDVGSGTFSTDSSEAYTDGIVSNHDGTWNTTLGLSDLPAATYTIHIDMEDLNSKYADTYPDAATSTFVLSDVASGGDIDAPQVTISSGVVQNGGITNESATVTVAVSDSGGSGIATVDGVEDFTLVADTATANYKEYTVDCAVEGNYSFSVTATDGDANTGSASFGFEIDTTAPTGTISYSTETPTNGSVTATLTAEGASVTNNGGSNVYEFTTNGNFTFEFADAAGNTGSATADVDWIDNEAPSKPLLMASPVSATKGPVFVNLAAGDGLTSYISTGGAFETYTGQIQVTVNNTTVTAYSEDAAGNRSGNATLSIDWIDNAVPLAPTIIASPMTATRGDVTVSLSEIEDGATAYISTDDVNFSEYSQGISVDANETRVTAYQIDAAGNQGENATLLIDWIDRIAPVATISVSPESPDGQGGWFITSPTITLSSNEGGEIHYTVNGGTETIYTAPFTLEDGTDAVAAWAIDRAGNTGDQVTAIYKVDTVAPIISIGDLPDYVNNSSFTVSGLYTESNLNGLGVNLNGVPKSAITEGSSFISTVLTLIEGSNTIYAGAEDLAGHHTTTSAQTVRLDTTAPVISGLTAANTGSDALITASVDKNDVEEMTLEVNGSYTYVEMDENGNVSSLLLGLPDASYRAVLTVTDRAGNVTSESATFTIDTIAPVVRAQITSPANGLADGWDGWYATSPVVTLTVGESADAYYNINGTVGESGTEYAAAVTISDGTNQTFNYWADDDAGNRASGSLTFAKVDTLAPDEPTINAPGSVNETIVTVTGTAAGASTIEIGDTDLGDYGLTEVVDGTYSAEIRIMSEGENWIYAYAYDEAGNMSSMATKIVTKDTQGPNLAIAMANGEGRAIITVAASETVQTTPTLTVKVDGSVPDGLTVTADGSTGNTYTYIVNQELSGDILIEASATDAAGNEGFGSYAVSILDASGESDVDLGGGAAMTFPEGSIGDGGLGSGTVQDPLFTASGNDGRDLDDPNNFGSGDFVQGFEFQINGGGFAFDTPVSLIVPVDEGSGYVAYHKRCSAGNERLKRIIEIIKRYSKLHIPLEGFSGVVITRDTLAPTLSFDQTFPALTSGSSFTVGGDLADNVTATGSAVNFTVNGGGSQAGVLDACATNETTQTAFSFTAALSEGENTISITASDMFGNERTYTKTVTLDAEAEVAITLPSGDTSTKADTYRVKGSAEAGAEVTVTFADDQVASFTAANSSEMVLANLDLSGKSDGTYVLSATATDPAGNTKTVSRGITKDTSAGLYGVDYPAIVVEDTATVTGRIDPGDTLLVDLNGSLNGSTLTLDGADFSVVLTGLSEGDNAVRLISVDSLNNAKSQQFTIKYDTDALFTVTGKTPGADALNGSTYYVTSGDISYTIDANRSGTFQLKKDGAVLDEETLVLGAGESQSVTLDGSVGGDGTYAIEVAGTEPGDLNALTFAYTVAVDNASPAVSLANDLAANVTNATFAISGSISDASPIASYEIYRNSVKVKTVTSPENDFTDSLTLSSGINEIIVLAYDAAGNSGRDTHTVTYTASSVSSGSGGSPVSSGLSDTAEVGTGAKRAGFLNDEVVMDFEAGTFSGETDIRVTAVDADNPKLHGNTGTILRLGSSVYEFDADGKSFGKPVTVTFAYDDISGLDNPQKLGVYLLDEETGTWIYVGGKVDPTNKTVTILLDHFSTYGVMLYEKEFDDIASHWAGGDISLMASRHIANGMTENEFVPDGTISRAQFATLLVRALGLDITGDASAFGDVAAAEWYSQYVMTAYKAGLVNGMGQGNFAPDANISREQMAVMIMRAYNQLKDTDYTNMATTTQVRFDDQTSIASWASHAVLIANDLSIINGMTADTFAPAENATRAQAIVMIKRLLQAADLL